MKSLRPGGFLCAVEGVRENNRCFSFFLAFFKLILYHTVMYVIAKG